MRPQRFTADNFQILGAIVERVIAASMRPWLNTTVNDGNFGVVPKYIQKLQ
jgi:hypothetical protein